MKNQLKFNELYNKVKALEKEYNSPENRTVEDIKGLYRDDYILDLWHSEQYSEETGEGWTDFEEFLLDLIKQNIEIESVEWCR